MFKQEVLFNKEECDSIIEMATEWRQDTCIFSNGEDKVDLNIRNSSSSKINNIDALSDIILNKVRKYNINSLPTDCRLLKYNPGSFFRVHRDRCAFAPDRLLTLIIQLSDENNYNGAELIVDDTIVSKKIGNLILHDSGLYHEVTNLIEGERYVLTTWIKKENIIKSTNLM
jgi:predicted 2-oxoglutarate/Fe(II)-dependent dioxygenase YbiX|tara:strand:+ start:252 stop:764 length:513 start_codon:yes stop_codon:yes gene_type:complete